MSSRALYNGDDSFVLNQISRTLQKKHRLWPDKVLAKAILLKSISFAVYLTFHSTKKITARETKDKGDSCILNWANNTFLLHSCKRLSADRTFESLKTFLRNGQSFRKGLNINNETSNLFTQCNAPLKPVTSKVLSELIELIDSLTHFLILLLARV